MANQKNFFYDYFDGQIIKEETQGYKLFKVMLISLVSVFGVFCYLAGFCNLAVCLLLILGMTWNFYVKLESKLSIVFCVIVSSIYFMFACYYRLYAHAIMYMGLYIPFQMFATTKQYYGGSFVQIKKMMNDGTQIVFVSLAVFASVLLYMFNIGFGGRFEALDSISAGCLISSAILRNERYYDYYYYRIVGLVLSICLWIVAAIEYNNFSLAVIAVMYLSYFIFDFVTNIEQKRTYENEYMQIVQKYKDKENEKRAEEKVKAYKKSKEKAGAK